MGLFDDDFYSTKVSRRAAREHKRGDFGFPYKSGDRKWSNVRIAFVSSFTSAIAATLLFGAFFGGGDGAAGGGSITATGVVQTTDPLERPVQASAKVRPAVVSIINEQLFSFGIGGEEEQGDEEQGTLREAGVGSGVIIDKKDGKAIIVTNYHVVDNAQAVKAVLMNGERREARIVGKDQITDLAVLEIDAKGIDAVAEIGDSSKLRPAEYVIAIGNPLGLGESVSSGIISKTKQIVPVSLNQDGVYDWEQEVIQIDASINQGNSGGPLIDLDGRVIGINSMKIADFGVEGIGFAIPINNAMPIVESLRERGYVPRPYLGVYTMDLEQYWEQQAMEEAFGEDEGSEEGQDADGGEAEQEGPASDIDISEMLKLPDEIFDGVIVLEAVGPAKDAGLAFNDVIVKLDGQSIGSTMELRKYLYSKKKIGEEIKITYYRDGKLKDTSFKLGEKEEEE
ncbi:S1C family serine protease [Paenibacillus arenilitoris]|uniref:Trypsin-like peptidase domain-containing protein n=1 Tax=Paenibacillus arenilitoris TaxID=2772299 RepID=A0A927CT82_9BACL|nr:trypsin-like peptidase domain-containing protein [Paenibacillus arenilitoris]MBD2871806.1 trypsin-like peptidase domain-containing protein [Paenibacillus arenilitoris]